MLIREGHHAQIFTDGVHRLRSIQSPNGSILQRIATKASQIWVSSLRGFDAIIVSDTIDACGNGPIYEPLRKLGKPVLLYEVFALTGSKHWMDRLPGDALHVFDGLLVASGIHDVEPLPFPPVFEVGLRILESPIQCATKPFAALLDFARPGYEAERRSQEVGVHGAGIEQFSLVDEYSFTEIAAEFRRAACAFVAFPEAFGVPIAQLQNQGALIFSPNKRWVKRHALLPSGSVYDDNAPFGENFVFYSSAADLTDKLREIASRYNALAVATRFRSDQPQLCDGNSRELQRFVDWVREWRP